MVEVHHGWTLGRAGPNRTVRLSCGSHRRTTPAVSWRGREARNEVRFRDQNEWIEATSDSYGSEPMMAFVCECGDAGCTEVIHLTRAEYESVRSVANRFAIALHHENPETEVVISESMRFAVVDKIEGVSMRIARDTDPRSDTQMPRDPRIAEGI